jgi:hypothetical protein|tara:strand:+ start:139 stop:513 length:375 start_codon:yes stop_codon:yes gene_type:complete
MKNFITYMFVALLFLAISCGDKEEAVCDTGEAVAAVEDGAGHVSKDCQDLCAKKGIDGDKCKAYCASERKKGVCYEECKDTAEYCKKACYGKKAKGDVVDSPDDATATKADAVSMPDDVSGTNG